MTVIRPHSGFCQYDGYAWGLIAEISVGCRALALRSARSVRMRSATGVKADCWGLVFFSKATPSGTGFIFFIASFVSIPVG